MVLKQAARMPSGGWHGTAGVPLSLHSGLGIAPALPFDGELCAHDEATARETS